MPTLLSASPTCSCGFPMAAVIRHPSEQVADSFGRRIGPSGLPLFVYGTEDGLYALPVTYCVFAVDYVAHVVDGHYSKKVCFMILDFLVGCAVWGFLFWRRKERERESVYTSECRCNVKSRTRLSAWCELSSSLWIMPSPLDTTVIAKFSNLLTIYCGKPFASRILLVGMNVSSYHVPQKVFYMFHMMLTMGRGQ